MKCTVDLTSLFKAFSYAMDIYLFCYDASFMATAPSFIAMSQGNHMDLMTFLSSSVYAANDTTNSMAVIVNMNMIAIISLYGRSC